MTDGCGAVRRQSLPLGVGAIAEFLRSIIYGTLIVHRLIRCKTSCQSTSPCSFTAVTPPAPGLMAGDADGQGDWNQYSPSRFPSARHSSTGSARAGSLPRSCRGRAAPLRAVFVDAQFGGETRARGPVQLLVLRPTFQGVVCCSINFSSTRLPE